MITEGHIVEGYEIDGYYVSSSYNMWTASTVWNVFYLNGYRGYHHNQSTLVAGSLHTKQEVAQTINRDMEKRGLPRVADRKID